MSAFTQYPGSLARAAEIKHLPGYVIIGDVLPDYIEFVSNINSLMVSVYFLNKKHHEVAKYLCEQYSILGVNTWPLYDQYIQNKFINENTFYTSDRNRI